LAVDADSRATALGCGQQRANGRSVDSDGKKGRRRLAGLSRTSARRHRLRRTDSDRLGSVNADRTVAAANRTGLVIVRGRRRSGLYPGAAGRRRDRRLLQPDHRRAGLDASRCGPVLGVQRRCRSPRHSDSQQRPCVHIRCNRRCQRAGRDGRHRRVVL